MRYRPALLVLAALTIMTSPPAALARRSYTVRVPPFEVPAGHNREICVFVPIPAKETLSVGDIRIKNIGGRTSFATHHLIVYAYSGDLDAVTPGVVKDDTACLNFGSGKPSDLAIVATSQGPNSRWVIPRGTALRLTPDTDSAGKKVVGLVLNSHWINGDSKPHRARAVVTFRTRKEKEVKRDLKPIFEVVANAFINVPPGQTATVGYNWGPGRQNLGAFLGGAGYPEGTGACVTMLVGHMHKRGTLFTADLIDPNGARTPLYRQTEYSDPRAKLFDGRPTPPLFVTAGQVIAYQCTHDNKTSPRLGCEEEAGKAPGEGVLDSLIKGGNFSNPGHPAKLCSALGPDASECPATDPKYPGRTFTGNCVEANLVFGFTSEDDMCILPGYFYDADPSAPAGQECTL